MNFYLFNFVTLQAASTSAELFMSISWIAILLAGVSFFVLGTLLGWWIWGAYRGRAKRIEKENRTLLRNVEGREISFRKHQKKYQNASDDTEAETV